MLSEALIDQNDSLPLAPKELLEVGKPSFKLDLNSACVATGRSLNLDNDTLQIHGE